MPAQRRTQTEGVHEVCTGRTSATHCCRPTRHTERLQQPYDSRQDQEMEGSNSEGTQPLLNI